MSTVFAAKLDIVNEVWYSNTMKQPGLVTPEIRYTVQDTTGTGERDLSEQSNNIMTALDAPIARAGAFDRTDNHFTATPLDSDQLTISGLSFGRVNRMFLDSVMAGEELQALSPGIQQVIGDEIALVAERRIEKSRTNMNILRRILEDRINVEIEYGTVPSTIDTSTLEAVLDLRAGTANIGQQVEMLNLLPEIGSLEIAKTTCPCDLGLANDNAQHLLRELAALQTAHPDWNIELVPPDESEHRIVEQNDTLISSKWISATIGLGSTRFDVVTKQSNLILPLGKEPVAHRNPRMIGGVLYDIQPLTIMQYLRPSKHQ